MKITIDMGPKEMAALIHELTQKQPLEEYAPAKQPIKGINIFIPPFESLAIHDTQQE